MMLLKARSRSLLFLVAVGSLVALPPTAHGQATWTGAAGTPNNFTAGNWAGDTIGGSGGVFNVNFTQTGGWFPIVGAGTPTYSTLNFANADYFISTIQPSFTSTATINVATPHKATILGQSVFNSFPLTINVAAGGQAQLTATSAGNSMGSGAITKTGAGLLLYNSPGFTGSPITLNAGTLGVVQGNELINTSVTGAVGTTFDSSRAYSAGVFNLATAGSVLVGASANLTVTSGFISGDITGGGSLIKGGNTTVTLGGTNQLRNITLMSGTLALQNVEAAGGANGRVFLGGSRVNLVGGTYENEFQDGGTIANDADVSLAGAVSGVVGNTITKTGAGALTIDDATRFNGSVVINAGTVKLGAADALRNTNLQLFVNDGLNLNGFSSVQLTTISGTGNLELGSSTLALAARTSSGSTYSSVLSSTTGGGFSVQRIAQTLQGANTYNGATTILSGGSINLSSTNGALVNSTAIEVRGGTFSLVNNATLTNGNRLNDAAVVTLKAGTLAFQGAIGATAENYGGLVLGAGGSRVVITTTTGAAAQLIAPSIVRQARGTVRFESNGTLGAAPGTGNANIKFTSTAPTLTGGGGGINTATISIIPYAVAGVNSGTFGLATYDATNGVRQLSTATEYAATIANGAGNNNNVRLTSSVAVASAGTEINALVTATGGDVTGAGTLQLRSGTLLMGGGNLNVANLSFGGGEGNIFVTSVGTINSVIQGTGGININGTTTLTLGTANTYSGGTYISGAFVAVADENRFGSGDLTLDGGTIVSTQTQTFTRNLVLADGGGLLAGTGLLTYDGQITGAGRLTVNSSAVLTNTSNSFSGDIQVGGTLNFAADAALGAASNRIFAPFGFLRPTADWTTGREVAGQIDTNGRTVTLTGVNGAITKTGAAGLLSITGSVEGLTVNQGTVELTGVNRGGLTVGGGTTLRMAGADLADRYQTISAGGATLEAVGNTIIDQTISVGSLTIDTGVHTVTYRGNNFSTSSLTKNGVGTLVWTNNNVVVNLNAGTLVISNTAQNVALNSMAAGATLAITHAGILPTPSGSISITGTLRTDADMHLSSNVTLLGGINTNGNDVIMSGNMTGSWALNKSGAGRLAITGTRGWTGGTNVNGGELLLTGGTMELGNRQITVAAGAVAEYRGIEIIGGFLRGAGTHRLGTAAAVSGSTILAGTIIDQPGAVTLANVTSGGTIQNGAALLWDGGTNTAAGRLNVNTTVTTQFFENNGLITVNNGGTLSNQQSDLVSGGGSRITVNSGGTMNLLGGTTLELQGALLVNNGDINGTVNVQFGSVAKGGGTFDTVNIFDGGSFSPGNSPGTSNVADETWGPGGSYIWEINDVDAGIGVDPGWDWINITNQLNITSTSGNPFNIVVTSLTLANAAGSVHDFNPLQDYTWTIATAGTVNGFNTTAFNINTSGFQNTFSGTFKISNLAGDINLTYTAIPEPSSFLLAGTAAAAAWWRRKRRKQAVSV